MASCNRSASESGLPHKRLSVWAASQPETTPGTVQAASGPLLSPDAMGIAACLVLFRHLATHTEGFDRVMFEEHYGALLAWAIERPEAAGIQQVIE